MADDQYATGGSTKQLLPTDYETVHREKLIAKLGSVLELSTTVSQELTLDRTEEISSSDYDMHQHDQSNGKS